MSNNINTHFFNLSTVISFHSFSLSYSGTMEAGQVIWWIMFWINRIICVITSIILANIWRVEIKKQKTLSNAHSVGYKWLNFWLSLTLILIALFPLFMLTLDIPTICEYSVGPTTIIFTGTAVALTYYQISRLYYCFASKQIHSSKFGYSDTLFIFLYIIGFAFVIYLCAVNFYFAPWAQKTSDGKQCTLNSNSDNNIYINISYLWYYVWDWTVLFLYVHKVRQFHRKHSEVIADKIKNKIKFILFKIMILTILVEINSIVGSIIYFSIISYNLQDILGPLLWCIEFIICAKIVILMPEHNHSEYMKMVRKLNKLNFFCCCKSLMDDAMSEKIRLEMESAVSSEQTTKGSLEESVDTKTKIEGPQPIPQTSTLYGDDDNI